MLLIHATTIAVDGAAVLIRGPSGAGKSDLALRLLDGGAGLVADDQTVLALAEGRLTASAPATLNGLLEVRGLGIVPVPAYGPTPVLLVVDLVAADQVERMPEPAWEAWLGCKIPLLALDPFQASAPAKVRLAVALAKRDIMPP